MNNKQMYKKLWLLPVLIIAFKLLLASSLWNFTGQPLVGKIDPCPSVGPTCRAPLEKIKS
jgi:hypothetical protein